MYSNQWLKVKSSFKQSETLANKYIRHTYVIILRNFKKVYIQEYVHGNKKVYTQEYVHAWGTPVILYTHVPKHMHSALALDHTVTPEKVFSRIVHVQMSVYSKCTECMYSEDLQSDTTSVHRVSQITQIFNWGNQCVLSLVHIY